MTDRLYYDNPYLTTFTATVLAVEGDRVLLDRSAFYPTSGGQPFDTGKLGEGAVTDVTVNDKGEVWHTVTKTPQVGETVTGVIDWPRRFDHMQQHAGEHMIAGVIWNQLRGMTIGLHLGQDFSTIDVTLPDGAMRIEKEQIERIEDTVNGYIQQDVPIKCWFPSSEELAALPLRKAPTVTEHVRIVAMGDFEMVACGGTHPSSAGQIGLVKILSVAPSRGKMRVSFVCGKRALADYRNAVAVADGAALLFSTSRDNLIPSVERTLASLKDAERAEHEARGALCALLCEKALIDAPRAKDGFPIVALNDPMIGSAALRDCAKFAVEKGAYALLATGDSEKTHVLFARPEGSNEKMGQMLSACLKATNGKGGGRDDMAQGTAPTGGAVSLALATLTGKDDAQP